MSDLPRDAVATLQVGESPTSEQYEALRSLLRRQLRRRSWTSTNADLDEGVDEAIARFLKARGRVASLSPDEALAYLSRIARNTHLDKQKQKRDVIVAEPTELRHGHTRANPPAEREDGQILALLEANATLQIVTEALAALRQEEDFVAVRVVVEWLNQADRDGKAPSARQVGHALGIAHTTVTRALNRVGALVRSISAET